MKSLALLSLAVASAIPSALAHGFVDKIIVKGGKTYTGPEPGSGPGNSIIRLVDNTEPNHIDDGKNLACGKGAATRGAKLTGEANPGDTLSFNWNAGDGTPWPHDSGPLITYMAKCDGDCSSFDATKGKYFKIDEIGKTKTPGNEWFQDTILRQGKLYDVKLPEDLPAGNYIVRHEIIALHLADQLKGAEFYPSCSQFKIGGSYNGTASATASFPGGYNENDSGIHINIWDKTGAYPFPGPDIATFTSSPSSSGSNSGTSTSSNPTSTSSSNNSSVSNSSSDDNNNDNSSSDDGYSSSNDANDDSGSNDSNGEDDECDDEGDDTNDNAAATGTNNDDANNSNDDNNSGDDECDDEATTASKSDGNVVYETVTVTVTVTVTPSATPKVRLARQTSSAPRRSRMHRPKKHSS